MTPRPSRKGDENSLKALWREVFGDTDEYIDAFFQNVYQPGMASVIEEDGTVVAAAYAVPFGAVRYIFAVATRPEYRGRGYGRAVVFAAAGGEPAYLCPASATLPTAQACRFRPFVGRSRRRNSARAARCGLTVSPTQSTATGFSSSSPLPGSFSAASTATFTPWTTDACVKRSPRARATNRFSWGSTAQSRSTGVWRWNKPILASLDKVNFILVGEAFSSSCTRSDIYIAQLFFTVLNCIM